MKKIALLTIVTTAIFAVGTGACVGCHNTDFEKQALGKSQIVKDMNATSIQDALIGYKNGTYGEPMKDVMADQVKRFSNE